MENYGCYIIKDDFFNIYDDPYFLPSDNIVSFQSRFVAAKIKFVGMHNQRAPNLCELNN